MVAREEYNLCNEGGNCMDFIKRVFGVIVITAASTFAVCATNDLYNKYAHNEVERVKLKKKINNIIPFKREK